MQRNEQTPAFVADYSPEFLDWLKNHNDLKHLVADTCRPLLDSFMQSLSAFYREVADRGVTVELLTPTCMQKLSGWMLQGTELQVSVKLKGVFER